MNIKVKVLSAAVGAALAGMTGQAAALSPADYNSTPGDTSEAWISGASAQDETLKATIARLCVPGTLDLYQQSSNQRAFFCSVAPGVIPSGNTKMVVYKSSAGGSGNGVTPLVSPGVQLGFMSMAQIKADGICTGVTSVVASVTVSGDPLGVPAYNFRSCAGTTNNLHLPSGGISDIEPNKFLDGPTPPSASPNQLIFGIGVSENLYRALQDMQGLDSTTASADPGNDPAITGIATIPVRDNEANMPSLAKDTIQSLFGGFVTDWSLLRGPGGSSLAVPTDPTVYVARRVPSSGTQKSTEIFLFGGITPTDSSHSTKCNPTTPPMVSSGNSSESICTTPAGVTTFEGSGTGNVRNCLAAHNTGGRYAIGLLSTETKYSDQVAKGFRFVKIDGAAPSLLSVALNRYKDWVEQSVNTPTYAVPADEGGIRDAIFGSLGSPSVTKALNATMTQVWGKGALLASPITFAATDPAAATAPGLGMDDMLDNPVNYYTKAATGAPDNCLPAVTAFPVQQ